MLTLHYLFIGLVALVVYKLNLWLNKRKDFSDKFNKFPGPQGIFVIGNALEFKSSKDLLPKLMQCQKDYGLTFKLNLGVHPYIFSSDAKIVATLLKSNTQINKSIIYKFLQNWIGDGLISAVDPRWKEHRRLITPTFHYNILKFFLPIFYKNTDNLVHHWKTSIDNEKCTKVNIFDDVSACALDIICETAMGIKVNALQDGKRSKYINSIKFMGKNITERMFSFWKQYDCLYNWSSSYKEELEMVKYIQQTSSEVIKQKRSVGITSAHHGDDVGTKKRTAFLDHLMASKTEKGGFLTDTDLREEVDTFIFAGHDSTATSVSFLLYNLACYPDVQENLYQEIMSVLDGDDNIAFEKLSSLKYLEMVIKESMRVYPTVPFVVRHLTEDMLYSDDDGSKVIPKGCNVAIFIYGASRNAKVFENPEQFDPERFHPSRIGEYGAFDFVPFSAGPRNCIGQKFALAEIKSMVSTLVKNFKFSKPPGFNVELVAKLALKSTTGIHLLVEARK